GLSARPSVLSMSRGRMHRAGDHRPVEHPRSTVGQGSPVRFLRARLAEAGIAEHLLQPPCAESPIDTALSGRALCRLDPEPDPGSVTRLPVDVLVDDGLDEGDLAGDRADVDERE